MRKKIYLLLPFLLLFFLFTACSGEGLFYTVENEEKIVDNNMDNVKFNKVIVVDGGTNEYYVALGVKIWYRDIAGSSWDVLSLPGGASHISSMVLYNGDILYTVRTGSGSAIYRIDDPGTNGMSTGSIVTNSTTGPSASNNFVNYRLFADDDGSVLCLNVYETVDNDDMDPYSSDLYIATIGDITDFSTDFSGATTDLDLASKPVKAMAFDSGSNAWLIYNDINSGDDDFDDLASHGVLYSSSTNFQSDANAETDQRSGYYQTVHYDSDNSVLLLSVRTGYTTSGSDFYLSYNYNDSGWVNESWGYGFNDFLFDTNLTTGGNYMIGCTMSDYYTSPDGYTLLDISDLASSNIDSDEDDNDIIALDSNYSSSDLIDSAVYSMDYYDVDGLGTDYMLIAGTSSGIWMLDSTTQKWSQE